MHSCSLHEVQTIAGFIQLTKKYQHISAHGCFFNAGIFSLRASVITFKDTVLVSPLASSPADAFDSCQPRKTTVRTEASPSRVTVANCMNREDGLLPSVLRQDLINLSQFGSNMVLSERILRIES